nr:hypothetical protein [Tanacetum cinerariifolium]
MAGIQRSGRLKFKGPVIKENSIDEAIDVKDLSDEEWSEYSGEIQADNTKVSSSTSGIKKIEDEKDKKITKKRKMDNTMGFGKLLHFKVEGIPSKLGFYVVDNFDDKTMEIKMENASRMINMESIADMIGIINKGCVKTKGICDLSVLNHIQIDTDLAKVNWCGYIWRCLKKCKDGWRNTVTNSFFLGPIALLTMMYVDGIVCKDFRFGIKRPSTSMWTKELLKERELAKIKSRGLGNERCGFERIFAAKEMYPGNTMFVELEKRLIDSLKYQQEESAEIGHASVHTEDETMENEVQEQSMQTGEGIGRGLDSPRYQLGPQTQAIVFETVDKQYKESERKKLFDFSDIPSFSLRLTQEEYDMAAEPRKEVVKTYEKGVEAFSSRKSESSPTNEVMVRGRRDVTLTDRMKSPFYVRVVNVDKVENSKETRLETSCLKKGMEMIVMFCSRLGMGNNLRENPAVTLIDSKKEGNKVTRKKKKDDDVDDMRVASILYLYSINHVKEVPIIECQIVHATLENGNAVWIFKSPVIHQPPQELSIQEMEDLKQQYLDELKRLSNLEYRDEIKMAKLKENFNVTPSLSIEEPDNSLSMGDEHLDTIPATESDKVIKSSVENLIPILSESEGIPEHKCDVPFHDNSPPLDVSKDQFEDFSDSNEEFYSTDDDSSSIDNIDYVEASPPNSKVVNSEVMEIVILEVGRINDDILLTIKDDILREKLLNVNLLIAKIKALNDNPTPSSVCKTKSSSTSFNSLLEETNTSDNSLPEFETFCFDAKEISSGSTTTHSDISLPEYEAFYDDHVKEISSGSPTTHFDSSLYASFIFDLLINPFPPADRSDFYEFTDELIPFISPPEYDCFLFKVEPNSRDFTKDVVEDISPTKEPQVHNALPTHPAFQLNLKFQPSSEYLFTYVVWIFLLFLVYSVAPHYLLSLRNEDTIFYPGICNSPFFRPDVSHRYGTFPRFKVLPERPMGIFSSTCSPMDK